MTSLYIEKLWKLCSYLDGNLEFMKFILTVKEHTIYSLHIFLYINMNFDSVVFDSCFKIKIVKNT